MFSAYAGGAGDPSIVKKANVFVKVVLVADVTPYMSVRRTHDKLPVLEPGNRVRRLSGLSGCAVQAHGWSIEYTSASAYANVVDLSVALN